MDYYATLGIKHGATKDEIKKAFHRLAHVHHPDKGGDIEKFKKINNAYQELMKQLEGRTINVNPKQNTRTYTYANNSTFYWGASYGNRYQEQMRKDNDDMLEELRKRYADILRNQNSYSNQQQAKPQKKWKYDPQRGMVYE